jgi:hypothetical protein
MPGQLRYPNAVTLAPATRPFQAAGTIDILLKSNAGGEGQFQHLPVAPWLRPAFAQWVWLPLTVARTSGLAWQRVAEVRRFGGAVRGREFRHVRQPAATAGRGGGALRRRTSSVSNSPSPVTRFPCCDLAALAANAFPGLPLLGYESGNELRAATSAGFEPGDKLRIWVRERE